MFRSSILMINMTLKVDYNAPVIGGLYQHYKGPFYRVVNIATHTETNDKLVIYHSINNPKKIWARPEKMFNEYIIHPDKSESFVKRFEYLPEK
jgi:hypothetical protein